MAYLCRTLQLLTIVLRLLDPMQASVFADIFAERCRFLSIHMSIIVGDGETAPSFCTLSHWQPFLCVLLPALK